MVRLAVTSLPPVAGALTSSRRAEVNAELNPVRKVVTLLQKMQSKVAEEAKDADDLYQKFNCYCKNSGGDLADSISAAETKIPQVAAAVKELTAKKQQLDADLKDHAKDRAAAKAAIAEATAIRSKEKAAYDKSLADGQQNLGAVQKAIAAISQGMGSFLQTPDAGKLRKFITSKQDMPDVDRRDVLAFLSGGQGSGYAPASGEIVGILKQMADEMGASNADLVSDEEAAVKAHDALMSAKNKEIQALIASIEHKTARTGEVGVEIATMKNDHEDTLENLEADRKFAADLKANCGKRAESHEADQKMRADETVALADTIKILNDDDALELFKATLPSASSSLLQVQESTANRRSQAAAVLSAAQGRVQGAQRPGLDFVLLALKGKKAGFGKVISMIDGLVASLHKEQTDDDHKKEYCGHHFDQTEDKITGLQNAISDKEAEAVDARENLATYQDEVVALKAAIAALDKMVAEATENRKSEAAAHQALVTSNTAAKELILFAKNRLNKFYNPKLYKAPPKRQFSEGDQIYVNQGGDIPTAAPGGIANTGITALVQLRKDAPPPPPATAAAYTKKSQESGGVIAMMDLLVQDLDKEVQASTVEEKNALAEYEATMTDSANSRRDDSKALTDKEAAVAELKSFLEGNAEEAKGLSRELMGAKKYQASLHGECDWLLQYFEARKTARADEIESLGNAKAVLSGADYSLVQSRTMARVQKLV